MVCFGPGDSADPGQVVGNCPAAAAFSGPLSEPKLSSAKPVTWQLTRNVPSAHPSILPGPPSSLAQCQLNPIFAKMFSLRNDVTGDGMFLL